MTNLAIRVENFMKRAGQLCPDRPTMPELDVRYLRLKLIAEELCELADAFGYSLVVINDPAVYLCTGESKFAMHAIPYPGIEPNLVKASDAVGDLEVVVEGTGVAMVVEGTGVAMGVDMEPVANEICDANDTKFIDGHRDQFGKWIKGPSTRAPKLDPILVAQLEMARQRDRQLAMTNVG